MGAWRPMCLWEGHGNRPVHMPVIRWIHSRYMPVSWSHMLDPCAPCPCAPCPCAWNANGEREGLPMRHRVTSAPPSVFRAALTSGRLRSTNGEHIGLWPWAITMHASRGPSPCILHAVARCRPPHACSMDPLPPIREAKEKNREGWYMTTLP